MTRLKIFVLIGVVLLVSGFSLLGLGSSTLRAQDEPPDYIGASDCADCHRDVARRHDDSRHALTLQDDQDAIVADFDAGAAVRMVQFPGEDAPRPFTVDDVALIVGSGRYVQRYLVELGDDDYRVLPAEWNVAANEWQSLTLADTWDDPAYDWDQSCAYCHTTGLNLERVRWEEDGVQCEACHGPGEEHADLASDAGRNPSEEELIEVRAAINPAIDPQTCGQCHAEGVGVDSHPYPYGYLPGAELTEYFTLVAADDSTHWWSTGHAAHKNMQYNEWLLSGHAQSLVALVDSEYAEDSCLVCHSADATVQARRAAAVEEGDREGEPPVAPTVADAQYGVSCSSCHYPHVENDLPNNMLADSDTLCLSCHTDAQPFDEFVHHPLRQMNEGLPVIEGIEPVENPHMSPEGPTCITCHEAVVPVGSGMRSSHTFDPIIPGELLTEEFQGDTCSGCHNDIATPDQLGLLIADIQDNVQSRIETARAAVTETSPEWITQALDFVEGDGSFGIHNYAYADAVLDAVFEALGLAPVPGR